MKTVFLKMLVLTLLSALFSVIAQAQLPPTDEVPLEENRWPTTPEGKFLPHSEFDDELKQTLQHDVTGAVYANLPFLKPGVRFIAARHQFDDDSYTLYALVQQSRAVKLGDVNGFARLGVQLRSRDDALRLAHFLTNAVALVSADSDVAPQVHFEGHSFDTVPEERGCVSLQLIFVTSAQLHKITVHDSKNAHARQSWEITRAMLANYDGHNINPQGQQTIYRVRETVGADGSYVQEPEHLMNWDVIVNRCLVR